MSGRGIISSLYSRESFEELFFTYLHELFDPSTSLLTKSRHVVKLCANTRSNGLKQFGVYPLKWAVHFFQVGPQRLHDGRSKHFFEALLQPAGENEPVRSIRVRAN